MQIPGVARAHCQQGHDTSHAAEPERTAATAPPDGTIALWDFSWGIACAGWTWISAHASLLLQ